MTWKEYQKWVASKMKDGSLAEKLTHMTLGLAGEVGEVAGELAESSTFHTSQQYQAITQKIKLELGDVLYYTAAVAELAGFDFTTIVDSAGITAQCERSRWIALARLCSGACGVADRVKKYLHYDVGRAGIDLDKLAFLLVMAVQGINAIAAYFGLTLDEVRDANVEKLNARYPKGFDASRVPGGKTTEAA